MAFEAYREPLYRRYYAPILSLSCVWVVTCVFFSIFIPIIISYNSGNFWMKEKIAYEQPDVSYDYIGIFHFYGEDSATGTGVPKSLFYSTSRDINNLFENNLRMAVVRSSEVQCILRQSPGGSFHHPGCVVCVQSMHLYRIAFASCHLHLQYACTCLRAWHMHMHMDMCLQCKGRCPWLWP